MANHHLEWKRGKNPLSTEDETLYLEGDHTIGVDIAYADSSEVHLQLITTTICLTTSQFEPRDLWQRLIDAAGYPLGSQPLTNQPNKCQSHSVNHETYVLVQKSHSFLTFPFQAKVFIQTFAKKPVEQHKDVLKAFVKWAKAEGVTWYIQFDDVWRQETLPEFGEDEW